MRTCECHQVVLSPLTMPPNQRFLHCIASNLEYFSVSAVVRLNLISIIIGRRSNWHWCMIDQSLSQIAASPSVPFLYMKHGPTKPKSWKSYMDPLTVEVSSTFPFPCPLQRMTVKLAKCHSREPIFYAVPFYMMLRTGLTLELEMNPLPHLQNNFQTLLFYNMNILNIYIYVYISLNKR